VLFKGFGNGAISFAYESRIFALINPECFPEQMLTVKLLIAFGVD
jgi:hypothetical protein